MVVEGLGGSSLPQCIVTEEGGIRRWGGGESGSISQTTDGGGGGHAPMVSTLQA